MNNDLAGPARLGGLRRADYLWKRSTGRRPPHERRVFSAPLRRLILDWIASAKGRPRGGAESIERPQLNAQLMSRCVDLPVLKGTKAPSPSIP